MWKVELYASCPTCVTAAEKQNARMKVNMRKILSHTRQPKKRQKKATIRKHEAERQKALEESVLSYNVIQEDDHECCLQCLDKERELNVLKKIYTRGKAENAQWKRDDEIREEKNKKNKGKEKPRPTILKNSSEHFVVTWTNAEEHFSNDEQLKDWLLGIQNKHSSYAIVAKVYKGTLEIGSFTINPTNSHVVKNVMRQKGGVIATGKSLFSAVLSENVKTGVRHKSGELVIQWNQEGAIGMIKYVLNYQCAAMIESNITVPLEDMLNHPKHPRGKQFYKESFCTYCHFTEKLKILQQEIYRRHKESAVFPTRGVNIQKVHRKKHRKLLADLAGETRDGEERKEERKDRSRGPSSLKERRQSNIDVFQNAESLSTSSSSSRTARDLDFGVDLDRVTFNPLELYKVNTSNFRLYGWFNEENYRSHIYRRHFLKPSATDKLSYPK